MFSLSSILHPHYLNMNMTKFWGLVTFKIGMTMHSHLIVILPSWESWHESMLKFHKTCCTQVYYPLHINELFMHQILCCMDQRRGKYIWFMRLTKDMLNVAPFLIVVFANDNNYWLKGVSPIIIQASHTNINKYWFLATCHIKFTPLFITENYVHRIIVPNL